MFDNIASCAMSSPTASINLAPFRQFPFPLPCGQDRPKHLSCNMPVLFPRSYISKLPHSGPSCFLSRPSHPRCPYDVLIVHDIAHTCLLLCHLHLRILSFRQCHCLPPVNVQHCWSHCHIVHTPHFTLAGIWQHLTHGTELIKIFRTQTSSIPVIVSAGYCALSVSHPLKATA